MLHALHFEIQRERESSRERKYREMSLQETEMNGMEFQELHQADEVGGFESSAVNRLNMLSLNGVPSTTTANGGGRRFSAASVPSSVDKCSMCGSMKRRSPSLSSLQEQQPTSKKLNFQPPSSANGGGCQLHGFTRLPLPTSSSNVSSQFPSFSMPILRRCTSDPINSPGNNNVGAPNSPSLSPENEKMNVSATPSPQKASASLPPLPPTLQRSVSDLTPSAYQVTGTPPHPSSVARTFSRSLSSSEIGMDSVKGESPDSKRLKRMKACMRGMRQWWDEVLLHEDEQDDGPEDSNTPNVKSPSPVIAPDESEGEAVSAERKGEWLVINFQCPCAKGYQIILIGDSCYYKLM